jgi:hypothetical protein
MQRSRLRPENAFRVILIGRVIEGMKLVMRDPSFKQFGTEVYWCGSIGA